MYAKIRLYNELKGTIHSVAVPTWGMNENEVTENVKNMVQNWQDVTSYSITKISANQIFIEKYFCEVQLYYRDGKSRKIKLNLTAETKKEAEEIAKEIISGWGKVFDYRIIKTDLRY